MANDSNIIDHQFQPGQSGNPNGRPKGSKNLKTIIKRIWDQKTKGKNLETGEEEDMTIREKTVIAMVQAALEGNVRAFTALRDTSEGTPKRVTELTGPDGEPLKLQTENTVIDYRDLPDHVLLAIINASKKVPVNEPKKSKAKDGTEGEGE